MKERLLSVKVKQNLVIAFVSVVVMLAIMEIILRLNGYGNVETYVPDQDLIWRLKPNQDTYTKFGKKPVHINSIGLRDREFIADKPDHVYRVLILGNSCTYGWGVGQDDVYSKFLEKKLNDSLGGDRVYDVINGGVIGYSIAQEFEYLKADGIRLHPDLVLISHTFNEKKRVNPSSSQDVKDKVFSAMRYKNILRNIALYHFIVEYNFSRQYVRFARKITEDPSWIEDEAFTQYQKNLQEIIDFCRSNKMQVAFLITVTINQIMADNTAYSKHQNAMKAIAEKNNIPVVDFMTPFRAKRSSELYVDGGHPNEFGHQLMAEEIYETLLTKKEFQLKNHKLN